MINLNTTVKQLIPQLPSHTGPKVGIELEYENFNLSAISRSGKAIQKWMLEGDSSLRNNGIEFVSKVLRPSAVDIALIEAEWMIKMGKARVTPRCGIHVHVNMTDMTMREVYNFAVLYTLAEPTFFKQFADGRETSHFCVPVWANGSMAQTFYRDIARLRAGIKPKPVKKASAPQQFTDGPEDGFVDATMLLTPAYAPHGLHNTPYNLGMFSTSKYSALNFHALLTRGTLEFRHFRATTRMNTVRSLVDLILNMRAESKKDKDPLDIIERFETDGIDHVLTRLGIQPCTVNAKDQEEAIDVATIMAGYESPNWKELSWTTA